MGMGMGMGIGMSMSMSMGVDMCTPSRARAYTCAIHPPQVAQATEPACLVPLLARGCERLVLVGDHCQLPPSVRSRDAEGRGLTLSLFGRLVAQGVCPHFLDTQYRAHPRLMSFSSEVVYGGRLRSGVSGADRPAVDGFVWPRQSAPLAFVEVDAQEEVRGRSSKHTRPRTGAPCTCMRAPASSGPMRVRVCMARARMWSTTRSAIRKRRPA